LRRWVVFCEYVDDGVDGAFVVEARDGDWGEVFSR
jgi:hypothetical protein